MGVFPFVQQRSALSSTAMDERARLVLQLAGLAALVAGIAVIYWPAALIVGGVGLYLLGEAE